MELTLTETAYLAGVFDGEGCIIIDRRKPCLNGGRNLNYILRIQITNTFKPLMARLREWGFYVRTVKAKSRKWTSALTKDWGQACLTHNKARDVLVQLLPYLIVKKQEAEVAIAFQKHKNEFFGGYSFKRGLTEAELEYRETIRNKLKELKHSQEASL